MIRLGSAPILAALGTLVVALVGPPWRDPEPGAPANPVASAWRMPAHGPTPESAPTRTAEGLVWVGANDLARLMNATKFWRVDVRKLVLRVGDHRVVLTADNPFVLVDDRTVHLPGSIRSLNGELQVPVALLDSLPHDSTLARLLFDPGRRAVLEVPALGLVGAPRVTLDGGATRLAIDVDRPEDVAVTSRSRAHFLVRSTGFFVGSIPESLPEASLVRAIRMMPAAIGTTFELEIAPRAQGFRIVRDPEHRRVALQFAEPAREDMESFAPEGPAGPRRLKVVAIDPGHGGSDLGVTVAGAVEKDLTLSLARMLRTELSRRLQVRVTLIREDDRDLSVAERAERANRARADLVISLHFDGFPSLSARGATAYCPPATFGPPPGARGPGSTAELEVLPWRDVAIRHAVSSRELAEDILSALELRAQGPARLRETLPYALLGVNAPGVMLECATLTSEADRSRVMNPAGLDDLAAAIADGVEQFQRSK